MFHDGGHIAKTYGGGALVGGFWGMKRTEWSSWPGRFYTRRYNDG